MGSGAVAARRGSPRARAPTGRRLRTSALDLRAHATRLAQRVAATGADVSGPHIALVQSGLLAEISLEGDLPGSGMPRVSQIHVRERWARTYGDQPWRLNEYAYELTDYERDSRFALHQHDTQVFVETHRVVVHEHCEHPIGHVSCEHYAGIPVADGYQAVDRLLAVWTRETPPDCRALQCLDDAQV